MVITQGVRGNILKLFDDAESQSSPTSSHVKAMSGGECQAKGRVTAGAGWWQGRW